jgi:outer membrane receptor protein involved in Fe transport
LGYTTYGIPGGSVQFNQQLLYLPEDSIFQQQNMGLISPGVGGFKLSDGTKPSDAYSANSSIIAGYVAVDNKFGKMVRLNWGARVEHFTQNLTAKRADQSDLVIATKKLDVLPSFNLIISPTKKQNIRLSGSQTLNRPEYRELAPFAFYDFNTQFVLAGNDSLKRARITNIDLRYEWFPGKSQILSGTFFYKFFENPIEQIARPDVSNEISYKNVPTAVNYGFELDMRASIGSLVKADSASFLNNLSIYGNLGIIRSIVDVSQNIGTPYQTRPLQGQSPYLFNGGIVYQDEKLNMTYTLNINRVGPRIYILGSIIQPDIWEKSRTFLDFQVAKMFLDDKLELKLNVQNILAQNLVFYQNNYGNEPTTKGFKRMTNALFLSDPDNKNGYDKNLDDMIWNTKFGRTISFALTYKF